MTAFNRRDLLMALLGMTAMAVNLRPVLSYDDGSRDGSGRDGDGGGDEGDGGDDYGGDGGGNGGGAGPAPSYNVQNNAFGAIPPKSASSLSKSRIVSQDEALAAVMSGQAASLPLLLAYMETKYPGQILDIHLRNLNNKYVYQVKYLSNLIFLSSIFLDATTLQKLN